MTSEPQPALILLNSLTVGGSEKKSVEVGNSLAERGLPVRLAYLNGPETLLPNVSPALQPVHLHRRYRLDRAAAQRLLDLVDAADIRRILCLNLYPGIYGALMHYMRPHVSFSVSINTNQITGLSMRLKMLVYRGVLDRADQIVFGSQRQAVGWIDRYRLPVQKTCVIHNGVDADHFDPGRFVDRRPALRAAHGFAEETLVLGAVAVLRPTKRLQDLLEAAAALRRQGVSVGVLLVGDGPERPALLARAAALGLQDQVRMAGTLEDVRPAVAAMDVFVLPSASSVETFSNAALEAMAMGRPVVLSDVGGADEMTAGGGGVLFPPADVAALTASLVPLTDRAFRERMGGEARAAVIDRFSRAGMVDQFRNTLFGTMETTDA